MQVVRIDKNGYFIEDVILKDEEEIPANCIETLVPTKTQGFYKPKWTGTEWIESLTQEEIDAINNAATEPTTEEQLMLAMAELDAQRVKDKLETQLAIAELTNTIIGGTVNG